MKSTLAFFFASLSVSQGFSQFIDWSPLSNLGGGQRSTTFTIGGLGYGCCGQGSGISYSSGLSAYNPVADAWSTKAALPGAARRDAVGFAVNGLGYVGMGVTSPDGDPSNDLWEYHPAWDAWAQKDTLPGPPRSAAVGFALGDTGYVCCGGDNSGNDFNDLWAFYPATNSWEQKADLPALGRRNAYCFVLDGKAYVGGGDNNGTTLTDLWAYDPVLDQWQQKASWTANESGSSAAMNGRGYLFWGTTGTFYHGMVNEYDPVSDTWVMVDFLNDPDLRRAEAIAFSINDTIYTGSGYNSNFGYRGTFWAVTAAISTGVDAAAPGSLSIHRISGGLRIEWTANMTDAQLSIFDMSGRQLATRHVAAGEGRSLEIPLPGMAQGCYVVRLEGISHCLAGKFMIPE